MKTRLWQDFEKADARFVPEDVRKCPKMPEFARRRPIENRPKTAARRKRRR
jgi:hypothetical protein